MGEGVEGEAGCVWRTCIAARMHLRFHSSGGHCSEQVYRCEHDGRSREFDEMHAPLGSRTPTRTAPRPHRRSILFKESRGGGVSLVGVTFRGQARLAHAAAATAATPLHAYGHPCTAAYSRCSDRDK